MENHPIPQDVTGFQFKLIGNMTVKQFAYLATGVVVGWIFLQLPIIFLLKFPISAFFAILGISLAFLPIEGRPMDQMIGHFIKAIFNPTQFVYDKSGGQLYVPIAPSSLPFSKTQRLSSQNYDPSKKAHEDKLKIYLNSFHHASANILDDKEKKFVTSLENMTNANTPPSPQPQAPIPTKPANVLPPPPKIDLPKPPAEKPKEKEVEQALEATRKQEESLEKKSQAFSETHQKVLELERKLQEVMMEKEQFAQELSLIKQKMGLEFRNTGPINTKPLPKNTYDTHTITSFKALAPTSPNVVSGVVKDPRGNVLPNILVEVIDKNGNSVRAFKTNQLGRFASATPLANGPYTVTFEDPKTQNKFQAVKLEAKGEIIPPIQAVSVDTREELRQSLFSKR